MLILTIENENLEVYGVRKIAKFGRVILLAVVPWHFLHLRGRICRKIWMHRGNLSRWYLSISGVRRSRTSFATVIYVKNLWTMLENHCDNCKENFDKGSTSELFTKMKHWNRQWRWLQVKHSEDPLDGVHLYPLFFYRLTYFCTDTLFEGYLRQRIFERKRVGKLIY